MQRVVNLRWQAACRQRHSTEGQSVQTFRRRWEAPGLVVVPADESAANLILFKREITRERWKGKRLDEHAKRFRTQQHSPPLELPHNTVSIFTGSAADVRKLGEPLPPAGYGFHVIEGGRGHEHAGGHPVAEEGGQINMATPNVQTITGNLAALVAFTRAIQWVSRHWYTTGRPVCVRYSNAYGAMIASGTWKAKKHKAMAAEARAAWKALKRQIGGQLWLRHVMKPGEHQWARVANVLAGRGKQGIRTQVEHLRR